MSKIEIDLSFTIIKEWFGENSANLVKCILQNGKMDFKSILYYSKCNLIEIKKYLSILIHQNIVDVTQEDKLPSIFSIKPSSILKLLNIPKYAYIILKIYGENGQAIFEEFSKHGRLKINQLLDNISNDTPSDKLAQTCKVYESILREMIEASLIVKVSEIVNIVTNNELQCSPIKKTSRKRVIEDEGEMAPARKKTKLDQNFLANDIDYWKLNLDKFDELLRHDLITMAFLNKLDKNASDLTQIILQLSTEKENNNHLKTPSVSYNEILNLAKKIMPTKISDQLLKILTEEMGNCIIKEGDSSGGIFYLDWSKFFLFLTLSHIESVVLEKFGSKALRIFRVIYLMEKADQKLVENLVMLEPKQTKEITYRLVQEGFVSITEVPRSADHAPLRTIFVFHIELKHLVQTLLQLSYKTMVNLMLRRQHEYQINRRVIEKHNRMEAILSQIEDEQQKAEFEEQMTTSEKQQVTNHLKVSNVIENAEIQLMDTIIVLEYFLKYCN